MRERELIEAGWGYVPAKSAGMPGYWRDPETGYLREVDAALDLVDERKQPPAPRPTCGTCPHFHDIAIPKCGAGVCLFYPASISGDRTPTTAEETCGQHPDIAAWIRDDWPKVRAQK